MIGNKRYRKVMGLIENNDGETFDLTEIENLLNEQDKQIQELKIENKMLKTTIGRNEAYINQIKTIGKWSNTGDIE